MPLLFFRVDFSKLLFFQWFPENIEDDQKHELWKPVAVGQRTNFICERLKRYRRGLCLFDEGIVLGSIAALWSQGFAFLVGRKVI